MRNRITILSTLILLFLLTGFSGIHKTETKKQPGILAAVKASDTLAVKKGGEESKLKLYKTNAIATYYADKFNGRKTSSGERFDNKKYTAAHMKLPFGTKLRVTNEANGKWVDVKVNDRGPFSKKLEIDLTKKAFMDIATNKGSGTFKVKLEIIE